MKTVCSSRVHDERYAVGEEAFPSMVACTEYGGSCRGVDIGKRGAARGGYDDTNRGSSDLLGTGGLLRARPQTLQTVERILDSFGVG